MDSIKKATDIKLGIVRALEERNQSLPPAMALLAKLTSIKGNQSCADCGTKGELTHTTSFFLIGCPQFSIGLLWTREFCCVETVPQLIVRLMCLECDVC